MSALYESGAQTSQFLCGIVPAQLYAQPVEVTFRTEKLLKAVGSSSVDSLL